MHIAIIGNGISGITAARFIRKLSDHKITVISNETDYFWSRTALMYIYMGHMRFEDTKPYEDWFWEKNRIELKKAWVHKIDTENKRLIFNEGTPMNFDKLIIASGSKYNKFGWPGQDLEKVSGMVSYQDLETIERHSEGLQKAVIVGGGLIGIELAEMFHSRHIPVTFLVREKNFWDIVLPEEEAKMINREIRKNGIDLRLETELKEILDDGNGRACGVITNHGEKIDCGFVGFTAGVSPNIEFLKDSDIETDRGILVNEFLETNIPGVFAVGDCAQHLNPKEGRRAIDAVWYTGRMTGETVAYNVCGRHIEYDPGIWYNSAKFFDIEYQVYGHVPLMPEENTETIYWQHEKGNKSIRLAYDRDTHQIRGFNLLGIRYRQEVCEKWIREKAKVEEVIQHLGLANFDPEFSREYEKELVHLYNRKTGKNLQLKSKRNFSKALRFLQKM